MIIFILCVESITEKRSLGRPRCWWENSIIMILEEIGINTRNWVNLAEDRDYWQALVNTHIKLSGVLVLLKDAV